MRVTSSRKHGECDPYDGLFFGKTPHVMLLIDWWPDKGPMPPRYQWPVLLKNPD